MASYFTAMMVALATVVGLHVTLEGTDSLSFGQDRLGKLTTVELIDLAHDPTSEDHIEAILQLGFVPGDLSLTVPVLAKLSAIGAIQLTRTAADMSLQQIGEPATEHLKPLFDSRERLKTVYACAAIRSIGPSCKIYMPHIKRCLASREAMMRRSGLYAIQGLGDDALDAIDDLIRCIESDSDFNNQCSACRTIEKLGPKASKAQPALLGLMETGNTSTRGWAAVCLGAIGQLANDVDVAKLLSDKLKDPRRDRRFPAEIQRTLLGIAKLGTGGAIAADNVREWSQNWDNYIKTHCAFTLWRITGESDESLEILKSVLAINGHQDDALEMIAKIGPDAIPLLDNIIVLLASEEPNTRELALVVISNMGTKARKAIPDVKLLLNDPDALVRSTARRTLSDLR